MSAICATPPTTLLQSTLKAFRQADLDHLAKREIDPARVRSLDGSRCAARSADGVGIDHTGKCIDLGEAYTEWPALDKSHGHTPIKFLPPQASLSQPADPEAAKHAVSLRAAVNELQFAPSCRTGGDKPIFYMHDLPQVGFGSVIEYAMMFLGRGLAIGAPLRLGPESSRAWTSQWFCGPQRSLTCYFNLSSCCAVVNAPGSGHPLVLPRRRDPINVGARGYNEYGSAWISSQFANFFFERMRPQTRSELNRRRAGTDRWLRTTRGAGLRSSSDLVIGMHIRRGDSCHLRRYCPPNLTSSYFAAAAELRSVYGANRILLATDDVEAAALCGQRILGFECATQSIERKKFESAELIENRVAQHQEGSMSGSAVALDALADIDMLADTDMFVMLLRSCFARVAYALAMGRKGRPPPIISLEAPWSPFKGLKMGKMKMKMGGGGKGKGGGMRLRRNLKGAREFSGI